MPAKRLVVTIHGINTKGEWQDRLKKWLGGHFEFKSVQYPHYRWFGATKLVLEPWILLFIPVIFCLNRGFRWTRSGWKQALIYVGIVALGIALAPLRRRFALAAVARQMGEWAATSGEKYVIAHSMGTYLSARTMQKYPDVRFHSAILTGCVLSRTFDWSGIQQSGQVLRRVLNEVAGKDIVARLAFFLAGLVPYMGHAGRHGFVGSSEEVHTIPRNLRDCPLCTSVRLALVHNLVSAEMGHSDHFITESYAFWYWLPFLWSVPILEFRLFVDLCRECHEKESKRLHAELIEPEQKLHVTLWHWTGDGTPHSLLEYMGNAIRARLRYEGARIPDDAAIELWTKLGVREVWRSVTTAHRGECDGQLLYPPAAVAAAVDKLVRNWLVGNKRFRNRD